MLPWAIGHGRRSRGRTWSCSTTLSSIVSGVEQGRATFVNVRRFLTYHLTDNVAELTPFVVWALSGGQFPLALSVLQIPVIDLGTDTLSAVSAGRRASRQHLLQTTGSGTAAQRDRAAPGIRRAWSAHRHIDDGRLPRLAHRRGLSRGLPDGRGAAGVGRRLHDDHLRAEGQRVCLRAPRCGRGGWGGRRTGCSSRPGATELLFSFASPLRRARRPGTGSCEPAARRLGGWHCSARLWSSRSTGSTSGPGPHQVRLAAGGPVQRPTSNGRPRPSLPGTGRARSTRCSPGSPWSRRCWPAAARSAVPGVIHAGPCDAVDGERDDLELRRRRAGPGCRRDTGRPTSRRRERGRARSWPPC